MTDDPLRAEAVALFNRTWDLLDLDADRSEDDDLDMVLAATASRQLWDAAGGPAEHATGDWQVARALGEAGAPGLALRFAERALATVLDMGATGWRLASAHEGVARAHALLGDAGARATHVTAAEMALAEEADHESRELILTQLASVPEVGA